MSSLTPSQLARLDSVSAARLRMSIRSIPSTGFWVWYSLREYSLKAVTFNEPAVRNRGV